MSACPPQATPAAVYDVALEAALRASRFGRRRLPLSPEWAWLLGKLAKTHGVAETYCLLRYLQHVMSAATPSADCLRILLSNLRPVLRAAAAAGGGGAAGLPAPERAMLSVVSASADGLLAHAFESYKLLCEDVPSGVADGPEGLPAGRPVPSATLALAVELFDALHEPSRQARATRATRRTDTHATSLFNHESLDS